MKGHLVALVLLSAAMPLGAQLTVWEAEGGRVVIHFFDEVLEQSNLALVDLEESAQVGDESVELFDGASTAFGFRAVPESDMLALRTEDGRFQPYGILSGAVTVAGGFSLQSLTTGRGIDLHAFSFRPREVRNDGPSGEPDPDYIFLTPAHDPDFDAFKLCYVKVFFVDGQGYEAPQQADHALPDQLRIKAWDLIVTHQLAQALGRPDLEGRLLGYGKIEADVKLYDGAWSHPDGQNMFTPDQGGSEAAGAGVLDVSLGILSSITQLGHVGTFPDGRAGMSMSTTSCNLGNVDVNWLAAMNEDHPGIAMGLFREMGGRFEQVGVSWIKHGFFALSNSQCIPCQHPSNGTFLGIGCSDTYGTSNNGDRFWLGPRDEWDAFGGTWTCLGSYFDGTPVDCIRSQNGSGLNSVDHRLEAFDADLNNNGATYYYEANYLVNGDVELTNNIGSRRCTMTWNGSSWNFATPAASNPLTEGPAVLRYGDVSTVASLKPDDGQVVVAVTATDLGDGSWRYEWALYNWNLDRKVGSFSIPAQGLITDLYFHDVDDQPANDWTPSFDGNKVTWTFPEVFLPGHKVAGPLEFNTLYNFGFTSKRAPTQRNAVLGIYEAGAGGDLLGVETLGPAVFELTASDLAPRENEQITVLMRGGNDLAVSVVLTVNGTPITPIFLGGLLPFVGGQASYPVTIPVGAAGITVGMIAADVDGALNVHQLSNIMEISAW